MECSLVWQETRSRFYTRLPDNVLLEPVISGGRVLADEVCQPFVQAQTSNLCFVFKEDCLTLHCFNNMYGDMYIIMGMACDTACKH